MPTVEKVEERSVMPSWERVVVVEGFSVSSKNLLFHVGCN